MCPSYIYTRVGDVHVLFFLFLEKRQTVLFSATQTQNVEDLAKISLKRSPIYVGVDDHKDVSTVDGLEQVCKRDSRWEIQKNYTFDCTCTCT